MSGGLKVIIVVFDGLRTDMVTAELTPHLARFRAEHCSYNHSHTVFPSETRVVASALGTGSPPGTHGLVANKFYDARVFKNKLIDTGNSEHIAAGFSAYGGRLITTPSLGEGLAKAGLSVAVVSSGSAGTTRLVNPLAPDLGHVSLCLRDWNVSTPRNFALELLNNFGPVPEPSRPNRRRSRWQTEVFLKGVFPGVNPDLSILWYTDPDFTSHDFGIGSTENREAIAGVDDEFGRLVEWWQRANRTKQIQMIVLTDHGHITARQKINVKSALADDGFRFDDHFPADADFTGKLGYCGALWVRRKDRERLADMVAWLLEKPWCGAVFTPNGKGPEGSFPGTFNRSLVMVDHERAPDLYYVMRSNDDIDANGISGSCYYDGRYPEGGSVHGGLHPRELNTLLIAGGSFFQSSFQTDIPAGNIDIAPTLLHLFNLPRPPGMSGRVLREALTKDAGLPECDRLIHNVNFSGRRQYLQLSRADSTAYIDGFWVEANKK